MVVRTCLGCRAGHASQTQNPTPTAHPFLLPANISPSSLISCWSPPLKPEVVPGRPFVHHTSPTSPLSCRHLLSFWPCFPSAAKKELLATGTKKERVARLRADPPCHRAPPLVVRSLARSVSPEPRRKKSASPHHTSRANSEVRATRQVTKEEEFAPRHRIVVVPVIVEC